MCECAGGVPLQQSASAQDELLENTRFESAHCCLGALEFAEIDEQVRALEAKLSWVLRRRGQGGLEGGQGPSRRAGSALVFREQTPGFVGTVAGGGLLQYRLRAVVVSALGEAARQ